jgi:hypothetical protein
LPLADRESVNGRDRVDLCQFGTESIPELVYDRVAPLIPDSSEDGRDDKTKNEREYRQNRDDQDQMQITHFVFRLSANLRSRYTTI